METKGEVPRHVAIIPDGNRRWSELHGKAREEGYSAGISKIQDVLDWCREAGVEQLTMWGFSTENFSRDRQETETLFRLFKEHLRKVIDARDERKEQVRIRFFGRLHLFPREVQEGIRMLEQATARSGPYQLNLLLSYGGRQEIVDAVNSLLKEGAKSVDERAVSGHLYTKGLPDPDLVIRTSGEQRLSGLLPWQTCYSELYFCPKLWPDFTKDDFGEALRDYAGRMRRYGK